MDLGTLRELYAHQQWADSRILAAVKQHPGAAGDQDLRTKLHHIATVQRGFLAILFDRPFDLAAEMRPPESFDELETRFHDAHATAASCVSALDEAAAARIVEMPWIPGLRLSVLQAMLQMVLHSQHHRGQCAMRLRELGAAPPMLDYILWLKERQTSGAGG